MGTEAIKSENSKKLIMVGLQRIFSELLNGISVRDSIKLPYVILKLKSTTVRVCEL